MAYILAVDVGTTFVRCRVYDSEANVRGEAHRKVELLYPSQGFVEICPETLWRDFVGVVRDAASDAEITFDRVGALGICTQRGTVLTWDEETGENFHNFVTWQCARAADDCKDLNNSFTMMAVRNASRVLYFVTGNARYLAGRSCEIVPAMVTLRLKWLCDNVPKLKERMKQRRVMAGCIGTWLLWKLTAGRCYGFEISLASSTGMFDPYVLEWADTLLSLFGVPHNFLPPVIDSSGKLGACAKEIFGVEIPITAMAGDQQAATFGCACFDVGAVKISLGTGLFVDVNTGNAPHLTVRGLHPLVGWRFQKELTYVAESFSHDAGSVILWAQSIGLFERVEDSSEIANSVEDSNGAYFVPAFSGLQAPVNDAHACASFFGLQPTTTKAHMTRAVLESIAFRTYQIFAYVQREAPFELGCVRCVGGAAKNDFICQMIADLCNQPVSTMVCDEVASLGIAFLAGLGAGIWEDKNEVRRLVSVKATFEPRGQTRAKLLREYSHWQNAVKRSLSWYEKPDL